MGCSVSKIANIPARATARAGSTSAKKIPPYRIWPLRCKIVEISKQHIDQENINYSNERELLTDDHESKSASNDVFLDAGDSPFEDIDDDNNINRKNESTIVQKEKGLPEKKKKKKNNNNGGDQHRPSSDDIIDDNDKDWFARSPSFKVYVRLPSLNQETEEEEEDGASESSSSNRPQIRSSASGSTEAGADPSSLSTVVLHDNNYSSSSSSSSSFSSPSSSLQSDNINKKKKMDKSLSDASSTDSRKSSRRSSISSSGRRSLNRLLLPQARGKLSAMKNYVHAVAACRTLRTTSSRQTTRHHKL